MLKFLMLIAALLLSPPHATAQEKGGVVAVVNNDVITRQDLDRRFQLTLRKIPQKLDQDQQKRIYKQTLNILVDEELQRQYANRIGLNVPQKLVEETIDRIKATADTAKFNTMVQGLEDVVYREIEAEIRLQEIVKNVVRPRIEISSAELDQIIKGLMTGQNVVEFEVAQIFIPADDKEAEEKIRRISTQISEGLPFADGAQLALSLGGSGAADGYLGWFSAGELSPQLEETLKTMEKGAVSPALQSGAGWHILLLKDKRETKPFNTEPVEEVLVAKISAEMPAKKSAQNKLRKQLKNWKKSINTLADLEDILREEAKGDAFSKSQIYGWSKIDSLPSEIIPVVKSLDKEEVSEILEIDGQMVLVFRGGSRMKVDKALEDYRNKVWKRMMETRLNLAARRLVRDLRRHAYIDIRLK